MGFKDRLKKFDKDKFVACSLNETTVETISNNCIATAETPGEDALLYSLFTKKNGFDYDSKPLLYSKKSIQKNDANIRYLLGQLYNTHQRQLKTKILDFSKLSNGSTWTNNSGLIVEFAILCAISANIYEFQQEGNDAYAVISRDITPTLSPDDPNFPAWWEEHRTEWED